MRATTGGPVLPQGEGGHPDQELHQGAQGGLRQQADPGSIREVSR